MKPHRFYLFAGLDYEGLYGWNDFLDSFHDLETAKAVGQNLTTDWVHIVDAEVGEIVARASRKKARSPQQKDGPLEWQS